MKQKTKIYLLGIAVIIAYLGYVASCTHDDNVLPSGVLNLDRGSENIGFKDGKTTFDKVHSNVNWSSPYLGAVSILTGRFDLFGFNKFNFEENNPDSIYFDAWVNLNTVNTSEPGRDGGCLVKTFFSSKFGEAGYIDSIATIKSTHVEFSTTDRGYIVTADLTFRGVTKSILAKLDYAGKISETFQGQTFDVYGFNLTFSFLSQTDFGVPPGETADDVDVKCGAAFKHTP
jgi:polyisoprenoid-binding protein YceI